MANRAVVILPICLAIDERQRTTTVKYLRLLQQWGSTLGARRDRPCRFFRFGLLPRPSRRGDRDPLLLAGVRHVAHGRALHVAPEAQIVELGAAIACGTGGIARRSSSEKLVKPSRARELKIECSAIFPASRRFMVSGSAS